MNQEATRPRDEVTEEAVAAYLSIHPDFLHRYPELAGELTLPHPVEEKTVSLVERQVSLLREQKLELKRKLQQLAQVAHDNEQLLERLHRLILELIDSADLPAAIEALETAMVRDFQVDAVVVWLFDATPSATVVARDDERVKPFERFLQQGRPVCGSLRPEQLAALFGEEAGIVSGALIPLCEAEGRECLGLIATGSRDPNHYHVEMGTLFLTLLGAVAARVIGARLSHEP